jgi:hypothetical protein
MDPTTVGMTKLGNVISNSGAMQAKDTYTGPKEMYPNIDKIALAAVEGSL